MTIKQKLVITNVAKSIRKHLKELNDKYNLWREDNEGLCGIGAYLLFRALKRMKYPCYLCININQNHCFVTCNNHILDCTADQFELPKVCIVPKEDRINFIKKRVKPPEQYLGIWNAGQCSDDIKEIKKFFQLWSQHQNPFTYRNYIATIFPDKT